jgi:protein-disulfide isomerase
MLNTVLNRYPGKVRVVFRNFPLNPGCNPSITHAMHDFACDAAKAGYCASRQGKFEPAYQALFENQASFGSGDTTKPEAFVKGTGVDAGQLQACEASTEAATAISRDVEEGSHLGVQSTPTFFVNGHKMEGVVPVKVWDALISQLAPQAK